MGDNKAKKVTGLGCKNGGMAWCPHSNGTQTDVVCRDGTPMPMNDVLEYRAAFRSDCLCQDGFSPRCRETNSSKKCPDGSDYDPSVEPYTRRCRREDDDAGPKTRRKAGGPFEYPEPEAGDLLDWWKHSDGQYKGKVDLVF